MGSRRRTRRWVWAAALVLAAVVMVLLVLAATRGWPGQGVSPEAAAGGVVASTTGAAGDAGGVLPSTDDADDSRVTDALSGADLLPEGSDGADVDALLADAGLSDVAATCERYELPLGVQEAAAQEVERYQGLDAAVLVRAGWLGLLGRTWGCVVAGPGWVDVCVVTQLDDGGSQVCVARMEASEWGQAYGAQAN